MNTSEAVSKKVGRPRAFEDWELQHAEQFCDSKTNRGKQNWLYMQRAVSELYFEEPITQYGFLPSEAEVAAGLKPFPMLLLTELGRLNANDMRMVATEIDKRKMSERDATRFVRRLRNGGRKRKFSQLELERILAKSIDNYCETHHWTVKQILCTVQGVLELVSEIEVDQ